MDELLAHPFFAVPPPKSLDRNDFSGELVSRELATEDAAATLTAFTAASLASVLAAFALQPFHGDRLRRRRAQQNLDAGIDEPVAMSGCRGGNLRLVE